jgi:hypothetical protein
MGLLDDAIREHLELKRLRGADPGEVAREQREALDPVPRDTRAEQDDHGEDDVRSAALGDDVAGDDSENEVVSAAGEGDEHGAPPPEPGATFSHVGQETAELDMRTVLGEESNAPRDEHTPARLAGGGGETPAEEPPTEDSLEWEVPGDSSAAQVADEARHEHAAVEDSLAETPVEQRSAEEPAADVLEETPDFLRDTPEQERLWFEQRPPRDFDFDK